jgi:hypothetical protein
VPDAPSEPVTVLCASGREGHILVARGRLRKEGSMPIPANLTEDDVQTIERDLDSIEREIDALERRLDVVEKIVVDTLKRIDERLEGIEAATKGDDN